MNAQSGQSPELAQVKELQAQVSHYQKLYQSRVEKDLQKENILQTTIRERNNYQEIHPLLEKKITDLENALLNLAKQKIKGKKDAERLLANLTEDFQKSKSEHQRLVNELETN